MGFENSDVSFELIGKFRATNRFRVFQNEAIVKGHFLLSSDGILYRTILGITFKVRNPEKYEVRFIADEVD